MSKYKLIIEYYQKGNKQEQIATLCSCSRMTVMINEDMGENYLSKLDDISWAY